VDDETPERFRELAERLEVERMMSQNAQWLGGRQMIVRFKKGGRIRDEHVYDSAVADKESQLAITAVLWMTARTEGDGRNPRIEVGPHMIGNGMIGLLPWENLQDHFQKHGFNSETNKFDNPAPDFEKDRFDMATPMRVADVIEQPNGTVLVSIESS